MNAKSTSDYIPLREAKKIIHADDSTIRSLAKTGKIKAFKLANGHYRYCRSSIVLYIDQRVIVNQTRQIDPSETQHVGLDQEHGQVTQRDQALLEREIDDIITRLTTLRTGIRRVQEGTNTSTPN